MTHRLSRLTTHHSANYNNLMAEHADVLIIGGGVIGLTAAYFLAREQVNVEVVDQGDFGKEASWAGAGIIPPGDPSHARDPFDQLRAHSSVLFPRLSAELREQTGIDTGDRRSGGLVFHDDPRSRSQTPVWHEDPHPEVRS